MRISWRQYCRPMSRYEWLLVVRQRGVSRLQDDNDDGGPTCDVGSFELAAAPPLPAPPESPGPPPPPPPEAPAQPLRQASPPTSSRETPRDRLRDHRRENRRHCISPASFAVLLQPIALDNKGRIRWSRLKRWAVKDATFEGISRFA